MREIQVSKNIAEQWYDDYYEFITTCRDGKSDVPLKARSSMRKFESNSSSHWNTGLDACPTLESACERALLGWPEGLAELEKAKLVLDAKLPSLGQEWISTFSVVPSATYDPDRLMRGEPMSFRRRKKVQTPNPSQGRVIKLVFNYAVSADIGYETAYETGARIMALIELLERNRYSVELWLVNGNRCGSNEVHMITCAKRAGEYMAPDVMAFLFCSREMDHRLAFSLMEQWDDNRRRLMNAPPHGHYPGAISYQPASLGDNVINISAKSEQDTNGTWVTFKGDAKQWIAHHLAKYGIEFKD